ncbi:MAG: hypothetical protein RLZZ407_1545 [Pseudomonadota bacterium]
MDNTLKILLGVLSVTGFITVVIPQGDPLAHNQAADVAKPDVTAPPPEPTAPLPSPPPVPFDSGVSVEFITGPPSIDGRPIQADFGLPFGVSPRSDRENPDAPQSHTNGYKPPVFSMPGAPAQKEEEEGEDRETNVTLSQ